MNKSNFTLHISQTTPQSFGALCHILLVLWFTAFLIMIADLLLLRNAWLRSRNRRHSHSPPFPYNPQVYRVEMLESYEEHRPVVYLQMPRVPYEMEAMEMNRGIQYMYHRFPNGERVLLRAEQVEDVGRRDGGDNGMEEYMVNER